MKRKEIGSLLEQCDGSDKSIARLANQIISEETEIKVGDTVAVVDETVVVGGYVGKAKVKSFSADKQYANISLPNGTEVPVQTSLLYLAK